ncbi:MAG: helix-turn-helix transcriptional regulator [Pseudomonadota bacterium]
MRGQDFKKWRKSLDLSQRDAADALGLKRRVVQYYEKGERDGSKVKIPKTVRLACYALTAGVRDYDGPDGEPELSDRPTKKGKARRRESDEEESSEP